MGHGDKCKQPESDALVRIGRYSESAPTRQSLFGRSISVFDLHRWLEHLPEASRPEALQRAQQLALGYDVPTTAAKLLLEIGDDEAAEAKLLAETARIHGDYYGVLAPLAQVLQAHQRLRGETAIYRALLTAIVNRAYARAYGHKPATGRGCGRSRLLTLGCFRWSHTKSSRRRSRRGTRARSHSGHT